MFIIDKENNKIEKINEVTFSELGFKERKHLQEWIEQKPDALGEEFLIIQKEFDGFNDTNERLDLLALDKDANLVIIENKLDDTGKDVTWQAIKYASYCSTLNKEQIRNIYQQYLDKKGKGEDAISKIKEFYDNSEYEELNINHRQSQRIILIARSFRKEVTSTVLWLLNFKIKLQCFRAIPFALNNQYFLTLEQIVPIKDVEDFTISMADKAQEDLSTQEESKKRHLLRLEYWTKLLEKIKGKTEIFQNSSPTKESWLSAGAGLSGVTYSFSVTRDYACIELMISKNDTMENKKVFDELIQYKDEIHNIFMNELSWDRHDNLKKSCISYYDRNVSLFEKNDWEQMLNFHVENMIKLESAMREPLKKVRQRLNETED